MANTRITNLGEDTTPADGDFLATVDVSDTTQSAQGSTKKVQAQNLVVKKLRTSTGPSVLTVGAVVDGEFLKRSGTSIISGAPGGGGLGDVVGPGSSTDNAVARFDSTTGKIIQNSNLTLPDDAASTEVGYLNIPQNSQSAAYTTVLADRGKHILHPTADNNARTFTIDSNANVAYPIGTAITFVNLINTVTIAITSDTLIWAEDGSTGSRTLAQWGIATAIKVTTTSWLISGTGLS